MTESESGLLLWEGPRRNTYRHGVCVGAKMKGEISQHKRPKRSIMMAPTVVANVDLGINRTSNLLTLINRICLEDSKYLYQRVQAEFGYTLSTIRTMMIICRKLQKPGLTTPERMIDGVKNLPSSVLLVMVHISRSFIHVATTVPPHHSANSEQSNPGNLGKNVFVSGSNKEQGHQ